MAKFSYFRAAARKQGVAKATGYFRVRRDSKVSREAQTGYFRAKRESRISWRSFVRTTIEMEAVH